MDKSFHIIFRGEIADGAHLPDVKRNLAKLFKSPIEKMERLFVGRPVAVKKNLAEADARRYQKALLAVGALTELSDAESGKIAPAKPAPKSETLAARIARIEAEQLSADAAQKDASSTAQQEFASESPVEDIVMVEVEVEADAEADIEVVSEEVLLQAAAPLVAENDFPQTHLGEPGGALSLRPMEGELLEEFERVHQDPVNVDITDISLAGVGEDLLRAEEKKPVVDELNLKINFDLAPVGSSLNEWQADESNIPPDLAAISLDD